MSHRVIITDAAFAAIRLQARYIAIDSQSPLNAGRWLDRIWKAIDDLDHLPNRHDLADENDYAPYEVRRVIVGSYLLLFTTSESQQRVWVIGLRHGSRLPRPQDLPPKPDP